MAQLTFGKNAIPAVKNVGVGLMVWGSFPASGPEQLAVSDGTISSAF